MFTIDPPTARDLDDALSVQPMPNGNFRVGVHIADVSHFVRHNTALDEAAAARATSVYLVQVRHRVRLPGVHSSGAWLQSWWEAIPWLPFPW